MFHYADAQERRVCIRDVLVHGKQQRHVGPGDMLMERTVVCHAEVHAGRISEIKFRLQLSFFFL